MNTAAPTSEPRGASADVRGLMQDWIVADGHGHALDLAFHRGRHLNERLDGTTDIPKLRDGGVTLQLTATWTPDMHLSGPHDHSVENPLQSALRMLDYLHRELDGPAGADALLVETGRDIDRAKAQGKVALVIGMEGTDALVDDLAVLRTFHRLGLRHVCLVHERSNAYGTGSQVWEGGDMRRYDPRRDPPAVFTQAGVDLIRECERLGILVDLTHLVDPAFYTALEATTRPVIVSHAGARALCDTPRYLSDGQVRAIAAGGGVVCASPSPLGPSDEQPGLGMLLATIEHFVNLVGAEHVGIGTDFKDQWGYYPEPFTDSSRTPVVAEVLLAHGHAQADVERIMGGSVVRVIRAAIGEGPRGAAA